MDDRKKKIILISIIIIILIVIIVLFLIFNPFKKKTAEVILPSGSQNENQTPTTGKINSLPDPSSERIKNDKDYPLGLEALTSSYAERLASYSSDAKFKNLQDLKILSSSKMIAYINDFISTSNIGQDGYEAQEAKALNNKLILLTDNQAVILVSLQLSKYSDDQIEPTIDYSKVELTLIKSGNDWQVDEAKWQ